MNGRGGAEQKTAGKPRRHSFRKSWATLAYLWAVLAALPGRLRRGLVNAFINLDYSTYKTNDAFKIGKKVIVTYAMSPHGGFS